MKVVFSSTSVVIILVSTVAAHKHGHSHTDHKRHGALAGRQNPSPTIPLSSIVSGMPVQPTVSVFTSFAPGSTPPVVGAPLLPSFSFDPTAWPVQDVIPPTDSPEVKGWLAQIANYPIPNIPPTKDGLCADDPGAVANAGPDKNCWWTCGGCLRPTDISVCPQKNTWGVSYDDGPSDYTANIINYLNQQKLNATFFIVGSRAAERPQILQTEYMLGHEISVHTWSHPSLTSLTNAQIVAELGWTKKIIHDVLGVTPNTFRAPYGDLDDRVRAIAKAMGLTPIQWTGSGDNEFDTEDWKIPGNLATGPESLAAFTKILDLANNLSTGFIVLEHDLFQQEVDMSIGYFLPLAFQRNYKVEAIYQCLGTSLNNVYIETSSNSTAGPSVTPTGSSSPTSTNTARSLSKSQSTTKSGSSSASSASVKPSNAAAAPISLSKGVAFGAFTSLCMVVVGMLLL